MDKFQASSYAIDCWESKFKARILKQNAHFVGEEDWITDRVHIFKLSDRTYAVVTERGCSCYDYSDADHEIFKTLKQARARFAELTKR